MISRAVGTAARLLRSPSRIHLHRQFSYSPNQSSVYRDARKYARPPTVTWQERLHNSASFIGRVVYPPRQMATKYENFGVFTFLRVNSSPHSPSFSFRILLQMWDDMAHRAMQHLKADDYIYVSGQLGAYSKAVLDGIERLNYKVIVKELNYVGQQDMAEEDAHRIIKSEVKAANIGKSSLRNYGDRLQLWQIYFANPSEWYDNRMEKKSQKKSRTHPDFKHRSTNEALWLNPDDPPWIRKQLEYLDSRLAGKREKGTSEFSFSMAIDQ